MRDDEFRAWLEARRWNGKKLTSVSNRMSKARRFERAMPTLGLGAADLDAAFDADGMEQVTERLRELCRVAAATGEAPTELVGDTASAGPRMSNIAAAVRNYRQFREAESSAASAWPALDDLRTVFLDRVPEFERFDRTDNEYERVERVYKDAMIAEVRGIAASGDGDEAAGRRIFRALIPNEGPLLRWQTDDDFTRKFSALAPDFYAAIGRLARDTGPVVDAIMAAADTFARLRAEGATTLTFGEIVSVAFSVAGMARPTEAVPFKISKAQMLARLLTEDPIFSGQALRRDQVERWLDLLRRIEAVMRDEWHWHPRDLIDVQGFAWTALDDKWKVDDEMDDDAVLGRFQGGPHFRAVQQTWTSEQTAAFCVMARAAHAAGLDWYHTNMPHNPVRLGRKPDRDRRAKATLGYLDRHTTPRIWLSDKPGRPQVGRHAFPLDPASAEAFVAAIERNGRAIADWEAPVPSRPGRWPDEAGSDGAADDTPIWIVTARDGTTDGLAGFVERGEWHLAEDRGSRSNSLVCEMQPSDRIVLRDFIPRAVNSPFDTRGRPVTAMLIRATGVITDQRGDGLSVGVAWDPPIEPRLWYLYTHNYPVWRLRSDEKEMARRLAAFILDGEPQDYDWFAAQWFDAETDGEEKTMLPDPTNLILYGPPGTGKTYATAAHAVRLCGEEVPEDRGALMAAYRRLSEAGRIEFVTFHQSMAYEDFVEGLRPSSIDEDGQALAAGFRLAPTDGIFRTIARRAEMSTGPAGEAFAIGDRQVFKMSIGDVTKAEWAFLFDEAIAEGYAYLGFGNIDWSDARFADREDILAAVKEHQGPRGSFSDATPPSLRAGAVKSPDIFRNHVQVGDLIVVSKGLSVFRALGVVEGDYEYAPRDTGEYNHRRKVSWLWVDDEGVSVSEISSKRFTLDTIYPIKRDYLNVPALERYANSRQDVGHGTPEPFVLVIDEINRANISKVFGELITLLEVDKRIGKPNELRVRLPYSKADFGVPANLHIVGTMNTADRSIALLDTALRRRFTFEELMPDPDLPELVTAADKCGVDLPALLTTLNDRIEYLFDREHQIGHAYFLPCSSRDDVDAVMRHKVIPLLAEYFYEDWTKVAAVLGDVFADDGKDRDGGFLSRRALRSPFAGSGEGEEAWRYRWSVRDPADFDYAGLTGAA